MGNLMLKFSSLIGADGLESMDSPVKSSLFGGIGTWFLNLISWVWELFCRFIYYVIRFVLNIVDFLQYFVQKLVGLDVWGKQGVPSLDSLGESDLIFRFIYHESVQKIFRYMIGIFFVLLIIFTIIAIVKSEYATSINGADVKKEGKGEVFKRVMKAIFLVFIIPMFIVLGVLSSNAILASIINAINGSSTETFGGKIFVASSYNANKYRIYANNGIRMPVTNNVMSDEQLVPSSLTVVTPSEYGGRIIGSSNNNFTGYMFSLTFNGGESKDLLYYVEKQDDAESVYNYIVNILGGTIKQPTDVYYEKAFDDDDGSSEEWEKESISVDLHSEKGTSTVNQAAYNTWNYNEVLTRNSTFDETVNFSNGTFSGVDCKVYSNTGEWAKLHDGGADGLVALPQEYLAMADIIDHMIAYDLELCIINIKNASNINWEATYDKGLSTATTGFNADEVNTGNSEFIVDYSDIGKVLYTPEDEKSEEEGAIYVFAYRNPIGVDSNGNVETWNYIPLRHGMATTVNKVKATYNEGWSYSIEETQYDKFESSAYADDYTGLVVARGVLESTFNEISGRPTQIVNEEDDDLKFKREVVEGGKWNLDFSLNVLSLFGGGATWRFKLAVGTSYSSSEVVVSGFSATNGRMCLDYNFAAAANPGLDFTVFFVGGQMNVIIFAFASILIMLVLGQSVWGLIARIYDIVLYFLIMPGVLAATPLEYGKNMYSKWQSGLIKKVMGAYGVLIGLNIFFVLLGPIQEASQLFTEQDIYNITSSGGMFASYSAAAINNVVYILFMLVALTLIKTLPKTISDMLDLGNNDVYSQGKTVKENVEGAVTEAQKHISGQSLIEAKDKLFGKDDKPGLLKGFFPGSAIWDAWLKKKEEEKNDEEQQDYTDAENEATSQANNLLEEAEEDFEFGDEISEEIDNGEDTEADAENEAPNDDGSDEGEPENTEADAENEAPNDASDSDETEEEPENAGAENEAPNDDGSDGGKPENTEAGAKNEETKGDASGSDGGETETSDSDETAEEEPKPKEKPNISETSLAGLKAAIIAQLEARIADVKSNLEAKQNALKAELEKAENELSGDKLESERKRIKDELEKISEDAKREQDVLQTSLNEVKDKDFDASGLDNDLIERYGQNQKLLNTKSTYAKASQYKNISEETRSDLEAIYMMQRDLASKRKATNTLFENEEIKALFGSKNVSNMADIGSKERELLASKGIYIDKKLGIAYSNDDKVARKYGIAGAESYETLSSSAKEFKSNFKENLTKEQESITGTLADKIVDNNKVQEAVDEAEQKAEEQAASENDASESEHETTEDKDNADAQKDEDQDQKDAKEPTESGTSSKIVAAARAYAESAKHSAEASKIFADISGKKLKPAEDKMNSTQKRLSKLIEKRKKRDEQQAAGQADTFIASFEDRTKAYEEFNKDKSLQDSIITKSSKAVEDEAVKRYNQRIDRLKALGYDGTYIYDKDEDRSAYLAAAEKFYKKEHGVAKIDNPAAMMAEFDKRQKAMRAEAVDSYYGSIKQEQAIEAWNKAHPNKQIKDVDDMESRHLRSKVNKEFEQQQENRRMVARNDFINDRLDEQIEKQRERVERRGNDGFIKYMAKSIVDGVGGALIHKSTQKDVEKLNERLQAKQEEAKDKEANIKALTERIQNGKDNLENEFFRRELVQEQNRLKGINNEIANINAELSGGYSGLIPFASRLANNGLRAVKTKIDTDLLASQLKGKRELEEDIRQTKQAESVSKKGAKALGLKESTFDLGGGQKDVGFYNKEQREELAKLAVIIKANRHAAETTSDKAYKHQLEKIISENEKKYNDLRRRYNYDNKTSYIKRKESILATKKQDLLRTQRARAMRMLDEAAMQGKDTSGYVTALTTINENIKSLDKLPPRFKMPNNAQKAVKGITNTGKLELYTVPKSSREERSRRVQNAKKFLAQESQLQASRDRSINNTATAQQRRQAANDTARALTQEQYVNKITSTLLKHNRQDLVAGIKDSDSATSILNKAIKDTKAERAAVETAVKAAKTAQEKALAVERRKALDAQLKDLQRAANLEQPSASDRRPDTGSADRARRETARTAQRNAASAAEARSDNKSNKDEKSASKNKKDKNDKKKDDDKKEGNGQKGSPEIKQEELTKAIQNELKKQTKTGNVTPPKQQSDDAYNLVKALEKRVNKQEKEVKNLRKQRIRRSNIEVPHIDDTTDTTPPDNKR